MKYLTTLLENNDLEDEIRDGVIEDYREAKEKVKSFGLPFDEDSEMMFSNHLLALLKRIYRGELIEPLDDDMMVDVSDQAIGMAEDLVGDFFEEHGLARDRSEIFLVATHLELALQRQQLPA